LPWEHYLCGGRQLVVTLWPGTTSQLWPRLDSSDVAFVLNQVVANRVLGSFDVETVENYPTPGPPGTDAKDWPRQNVGRWNFTLVKVVAGV
jgi:hypothetical protein